MTTRTERRQRDDLNRFRKLTIGQERIWKLQRIAASLEYEADMAANPEVRVPAIWESALRVDALFLNRLAWDLEAQHDAVHGRRPSLDSQGPRP